MQAPKISLVAFVHRTGLVCVQETCGVLRHPMGEFVTCNVDVVGETPEDHVVSVAEDHPGAVPESVIVVHIVVYVRIQIQAKVVSESRPRRSR